MGTLNKESGYVQLALRVSTLERLLQQQALHLDEVHCTGQRSKAAIVAALTQALAQPAGSELR